MKIVLLGDGLVGKTHLVQKYLKMEEKESSFRDEYPLTTKQGQVTVVDLPGQEDYACLRPKEYPNTHAFILLGSVLEKSNSFANLNSWLIELKQANITNTPVLIVGVDTEQRSSTNCMSTKEANDFVEKLKKLHPNMHIQYCECSMTNEAEVNTVFETAFAMAAEHQLVQSKQDVSKITDKTMEGVNRYGFHSESSPQSMEERNKEIQQKIEERIQRKGIQNLDPSRISGKTFTM